MVTEKQDYYEVLGLERTAGADEIKKAYRLLARKYHPDVNDGDKTSEEKFKEVAEAYEVLSDDAKRARYDRFGHQAAGGGGAPGGGQGFDGFGGLGDLFEMFMGGNAAGGQRSRSGPQRGSDLRYDLEVTLEEAYRGAQKTLRFPRVETCETCKGNGAAPGTQPETCTACGGAGQVRQTQNTFFGTVQTAVPCARCGGRGKTVKDPCVTCHGQGRIERPHEITIDVPPGVDDGMQMPIRGEGEAGRLGGPSGDLYVFFEIKADSRFERRGRELYTELPISFPQAALGDEIPVPTISGENGTITVPRGTQTGTVFRLRGQGMPDVHNPAVRGNLHVGVKVVVPNKLSADEERALREYATAHGDGLHREGTALDGDNGGDHHKDGKEHKGFFDRLKDAFTGHEE